MEYRRSRAWGVLAPLAMGFVTMGCSGVPVPTSTLVASRTAIRLAEQAGGESAPRAAEHLSLARSQLAMGEDLIRRGKNRDANLALSRAQADAELAFALTRETMAERAAQKAIDEARVLREQGQ